MGELDEAIRQHISLKRKHGATDSEVRELEQDAFGPAERPAAPSEVTPAEAQPVPGMFQEQPGEEPFAEPEPPKATAAPAADAPPIVDIPTEEAPPPFEVEEPEAPAPAPEPAPPTPEPEPPAAEPAPESEGTDPGAELGLEPDDGPSFFDQSLDEEHADEEEPSGDTGETSLYDELDALLGDEEQGEVAVEEEQGEEQSQQPEEEQSQQPEEPDEDQEGDELLEETPDFLQDNPEQDDLWFDQQPPKDFDFDD